jgi:Chaperone of endosialidase
MAVPYTFGTATSSIPLSQLDSNFNTVITLGNTAIQLGNTVTTLNNMTLANVTISSGNVTITNVAITTANVTTANITTAVIGTETVTTSTITTANVTTANITTDNITNGTVITSLTLSYGTANGVAYLNGSKVLTTGSAFVFDGTNVGIGTTSPAGKLHVSGGRSYFTASSEQFDIALKYNAGTSGVWLGSPGTDSFTVATEGGTERMRIDSSGNVGIGTNSNLASSKLDVRGRVRVGSGNSSGDAELIFSNYASATTAWDVSVRQDVGGANNDLKFLRFNSSGTYQGIAMQIDSAGGNLLVGDTSFNRTDGRLRVKGLTGVTATSVFDCDTTASFGQIYFCNPNGTVGSITTSGSLTSFNVSSDQRLKENIVDAPEFGSVIDSLQVRSFDWKTDQTHQRAGFIAQELVAVAPEAVHQPVNKDDMMAVDYSKLVPMLVKEIQSLRKRLADAGIA